MWRRPRSVSRQGWTKKRSLQSYEERAKICLHLCAKAWKVGPASHLGHKIEQWGDPTSPVPAVVNTAVGRLRPEGWKQTAAVTICLPRPPHHQGGPTPWYPPVLLGTQSCIHLHVSPLWQIFWWLAVLNIWEHPRGFQRCCAWESPSQLFLPRLDDFGMN